MGLSIKSLKLVIKDHIEDNKIITNINDNLKHENSILLEQNKKLKSFHNAYYESFKARKNDKITLSAKQQSAIQTSLVPFNSALLRSLTKYDLIIIIINRERFLYEKIREYENSIKHNDRQIFKNQQKEIKRLMGLITYTKPTKFDKIKATINRNCGCCNKKLKEVYRCDVCSCRLCLECLELYNRCCSSCYYDRG